MKGDGLISSVKRFLRFLDDETAQEYTQSVETDVILNKERGVKQYVAYMLDRTNTMFEWNGLPDTIPAYMLELYLQTFGYAAFVKVDETQPIRTPEEVQIPAGVYIFFGGVGGERDIYYRPKMFTAANPRLKGSIQSTIIYKGDDPNVSNPCVIMPSDRNYMGLLPLFNRYASQLVENDISIRSAQINARAQVAITASTDNDKEAARKYLDDLEAGKIGVLGSQPFLDGIQVTNVGVQSANLVIQLIELQQYLKASWFNELGLNVNFNMKREYMSEEEIAVNTDILLPLIDDMLRCRQEAAEYLNEVFGLNVTVEKSSAWANKEREETAALAEQEASAGIESTKVDGGIGDEENVQEEVQRGESERGEEVQGNDEAGNDGTSEPNDENSSGESADIKLEISVKGGDDDEPEASEESEKSDAE